MTRKLINKINNVYDSIINYGVSILLAKKELYNIIKKTGKNEDCKKIDEWVSYWKELGNVNRNYYRVFSKYVGEDINIVPDDICHNIIEPILNPKRFLSTYEDKCIFDKMLWTSFHENVTPFTYIRNINGANYDYNYSLIDSIDKVISSIPNNINNLIIKKSIDSSSGKGVVFVQRNSNGEFFDPTANELLSEKYLKQYFNKNYIVQKVMKQSAFMSQFCKTSVNTIRMAVYRSVKTNKTYVINTIIRIGKDGSLIDNAHAGGMFVGINKEGFLGKYCCNQYGERKYVFNNVDFTSQSYQIPNYEKVKEFAQNVADALPHHRLIALDIMLDEGNKPVLLEYNIRAFGLWLFQFTNGSAFGEFTDEIVEYCKEHKREATRISVIF